MNETTSTVSEGRPSVSQRAPDFTLPNQKGEPWRLSEAWARGPVVLYFYPKDETWGCTAEACSFRDSYEDFVAAGAEVVGVSDDSVESHVQFSRHHRLPFTLLADVEGRVRKLYGLRRQFGLLRPRVTFVIDKRGVVRHVFESQVMATKHVQEAAGWVRRLREE